jgi:hypothetical protein
LLWFTVMGCGGSSEDPPPWSARGRANIDELQKLSHTPRACEDNKDCPAGSHCGDETQRCEWSCFADSDCGNDAGCNERGECEPAKTSGSLSTSTVTSHLAADTATCLAIPLPDRLAALADLDGNPVVCFDDGNCPCGAYCDNDATCRFDCSFDNPSAPPFCAAGQVCSSEGRCILPSHSDDPSIIADLELSPDVVHGDTATTAVVVNAEVRIHAKLPAQLAQANNVTVRLQFAERSNPPTPLMPRVRCSSSEAFAATCELGPGWQFGSVSEPLRSSPRTISIEIPQGTVPDDWSLIARSEWSDAAVSLAVLAQPVIEPPHETGHFVGTVSWPQPGGSPLSLPVEADVTASRLVLFDPSRLLLPDGHAVLSRNAAETTSYAWLNSDHASQGPQQALALLDVESWAFDAANERITSSVRLTLGNGPDPAVLTLRLTYATPTIAATCSTNASCGAGSYCNGEIGLCLAGTRSNTTVSADGLVPSTLLFSAQRFAWAAASNGLRSYQHLFGGDDIIGMERAVCFNSPSQTTAGRIGSSNANPSLDATCADGSNQQVFPYADRTNAVIPNGSGGDIFNLLATCLEDLKSEPTGPYTPANLLQQKQCVSVARFMLATSAPTSTTSNYPQIARRRLANQLTRQWVTLHAMIARGALQQSEYDEAVGGQLDQPASQKLGSVVDVMEKGWRLVVRAKRNAYADASAETAAAQQPDYRTLGRPVAHWTFNQNLDGLVDDVENDYDLRFSNYPTSERARKYLVLGSALTATCKTDKDVALPSRHFSLVAWLGVANTLNSYNLFEKKNGFDTFRIRIYNSSSTTRRITVSNSMILGPTAERLNGSVSFDIPAEAGYYAFVADGNKFRIFALRRDINTGTPIENEYSPISTYGSGPFWGAPGKVSIGCHVPQGIVLVDELSLWDRPLPIETVRSFAYTYLTGTGGNDPPKVSLPPRQLVLSPSDEPSQGLAVHLVDASAAHMSLLSAYVRAERDNLFGECSQSTLGPARTRVLDRVGRALRLVTVIENDARDLVAMAGATATPWLTRFQSTSRLLAGKRAEVVQQLELATRCGNPLGIADDDLPLYHGEEVGESARFFASSRFLSREARQQVSAAQNELELARGAWQQQRVSAFQNGVLAPAEKAERIRKIETEYEGVLRRLCGAPSAGTLLAGFRNHTLTSANCFLKLEAPGCSGAETMTIKAIPASCLRGEIGEQILAIQGAEIDARNADNAYERALGLYDSEMQYCTRRQEYHEETQRIQTAHNEHMKKLRDEKRTAGFLGGMVKAAIGIAVGAAAGQPSIAIGSFLEGVGLVAGKIEEEFTEDEQEAEAAHQLVLAARSQALDLMACFHGADNQKFAIDAARDVIARAYHDTKGAVVRMENQQAEIRALIDQAIGDVDLENSMVRVLPHHHYWLDDHIDAYRRHFRYAQRLTYLALRAFEYESQQSLGFGNAVLAARTPAVLDQVVLVLEQRTAPMQGEQGYVVGSFNPVMSLRDEILRLGTVQAQPGFPQLSSIAALRAYLSSDAAKIYSNGQYVGRGIRFSLRPQPWAQFSCAERIWRITTALQVEGSPVNNARLLLWQENSFGSQRCRAADRSELHVARVRPEHNLLVGDGGNFDGSSFVRPLRYTAMGVTGLGNKSREEMVSLLEGTHSGFAGRGLYGNYVLLFPSAQFDNAVFLSTVKDVLIRFDLVEVTDISGDPNP